MFKVLKIIKGKISHSEFVVVQQEIETLEKYILSLCDLASGHGINIRDVRPEIYGWKMQKLDRADKINSLNIKKQELEEKLKTLIFNIHDKQAQIKQLNKDIGKINDKLKTLKW